MAGPQLRLSLVLVPWALLLLFYFLRRLGKQGELVGQISGVVFAGVAVLRYEQLNDWVVRLFGIGADQWVLAALIVTGARSVLSRCSGCRRPAHTPASGACARRVIARSELVVDGAAGACDCGSR